MSESGPDAALFDDAPADVEIEGVDGLTAAIETLRRRFPNPDQRVLPVLASLLDSLSDALLDRFAESGDDRDLWDAVTAGREAVAVMPAVDADRTTYLSNLADALRALAEHVTSAELFNESVATAREATADSDHANAATHLANLSASLQYRFQLLGDPADVEEAVVVARRALAQTPPSDEDRPARLNLLGVALRARGDLATDAAVQEAASLLEQAVDEAHDEPYSPIYQANLTMALRDLYSRTGELRHLDRAVSLGRSAAQANVGERPSRLSTFAAVLVQRFEAAGAFADLDDAIDLCREAVGLTPASHVDYPMHQTNLGLALTTRYERLARPGDLEGAIAAGRAAVAATLPTDPDRALRLANLGSALSARYDMYGALADLDEAIENTQLAAASVTDPAWLSNACILLYSRFGRTRSAADLNEAISTGYLAVSAMSSDHIDRAAMLSNLSLAVLARCEVGGDRVDTDEAVRLARAAVAATAVGSPDRARYLVTLSTALTDRSEYLRAAAFAHRDAIDDINEAVRVAAKAVESTTAVHPDRTGYLHNLASALMSRFGLVGDGPDRLAARELFREGSAVLTAPVSARAACARRWAAVAAASGDWNQALTAYSITIELMARAAPPALARADQEFMLGRLAGTGSDAVASALNLDAVDEALRLVEQGRAVLFTQALDARSASAAVAPISPRLAARLERLRHELDRLR
jgi:hypothetical protein